MNVLKLLGYTLLFAGLLAVGWKQFAARQIIMEPVVEQWQKMKDGQSYDRVYVRDAVEKAGRKVWDRTAPWFLFPASIMLLGGIILAQSSRRDSSPSKSRYET